MKALIVIPARMAATRLPGKPLAAIGDSPMIAHVARAGRAAGCGRVVVAAGDPEIVAAVVAAGGEAVLTNPDLPSGSDRVLAAAHAVDPEGAYQVVVNLQGDMPFIAPETIIASLAPFARVPKADIVTLVAPESGPADRDNPNVVKAILAMRDPDLGRALYFTRSTLYGDQPVWRHLGLYAYRRAALERFCAAPPSPLEQREKLEQLRALEMGLSIWAGVVQDAPLSVDTPEDLEAARQYWSRTK